jgi:hypothetical protein
LIELPGTDIGGFTIFCPIRDPTDGSIIVGGNFGSLYKLKVWVDPEDKMRAITSIDSFIEFSSVRSMLIVDKYIIAAGRSTEKPGSGHLALIDLKNFAIMDEIHTHGISRKIVQFRPDKILIGD